VRVDLAGAGGSMEPLGWSSDGAELLLLRTVPHFPGSRQPPFDAYLYILHADGTETQVTPDSDVGGGAISPDGSLVAFFVGPPFHLFVVDAEGREPARIAADGLSPTFSPDGSQIAYVVLNTGGAHVWVANADGGDAHEILADEPALIEGVFDLAWSPTGDRIAMGNSLERHEAIYTFAPDGSDFTEVIRGGSSPFWSPDGSQIAYTLPHGYTTDDGEPIGEQSSRLAIANADGSNVREFDFWESGPWHPGTLQ
jgi:Tol biopolymer transport system component